MLTSRGWWFLILLITLCGVGGVLASRDRPALWCAVFALGLWFFFEWSAFLYRARIVLPKLAATRSLRDGRGPVTMLWCHQTYQTRVEVQLAGGRLPIAELVDRRPVGADLVDEPGRLAGVLEPGSPVTWNTTFRAATPGVVRFEGVRVRLADAQGFFYVERFLRDPLEVRALPADPVSEFARRADKRVNLLPPPGVHRHRRPGTGSELLELRDYRPGDPPRQIAWKISARRDTLITREYESEVPLRCTLVIDSSAASRRGPAGQTPLARSAGVAAAVARVAVANRDLVGLIIADEASSDYLPPARTAGHLVALLDSLARVAPAQPEVATDDVARLVPRAWALASDIYPELLAANVNRFPGWLPWLSPPPVYKRQPGAKPAWSWYQTLMQINSPIARRRLARRKRLAALICARYSLPNGSLGLLLDDDLAMATWLQRLLADHRVPYDLPERDRQGNDLFADPGSLHHQARRLIHAVGRGRDNELFVLLGDYSRRHESLGELLRAVRVARARHHQVLVVQPGSAPADPGPRPTSGRSRELLDYAARSAAWRAWTDTRRAFGRLGATTLAADAGDPVRLILRRLEQMRNLQAAGRT